MKIGEIAAATATKVETVRFYEKAGLLPPPARTDSNYRSYGTSHLQRLSFIRRARQLGISLDDVRELLALADDKAQSCEAVDAIASSHLLEIERKLADLNQMAAELKRMIGHCHKGRVGDCLIIETLAMRSSV
jgi:Cu(I)-responsive transcriptional regulator